MIVPTTRKAELGDIPAIQRLYRQLDGHHAELLPEVFQSIDGDVRANDLVQQWIDRDDADYLVAEQDGRVVGFINIERASHPDFAVFRPRAFAHIENAVVDAPHRGQGIGRRLFDAAVAWANEKGLRYVQVSVWHDNEGAREFYLIQGFRPMTTRLELDTERSTGTTDASDSEIGP